MADSDADYKRIAQFLYEVGTMRKLARVHRQTLHEDDFTDNIATHTYRVAMIGWQLAKLEGADPYKVAVMCLLHDIEEIRSNDHNWVHKRYVKIFDEEILKDQLGTMPDTELFDLAMEYEARESREAIIVKDADILDQVLLLREYEMRGNVEAHEWLWGNEKREMRNKFKLEGLQTDSARKLGEAIYEESPSSWWEELWTNKNR